MACIEFWMMLFPVYSYTGIRRYTFCPLDTLVCTGLYIVESCHLREAQIGFSTDAAEMHDRASRSTLLLVEPSSIHRNRYARRHSVAAPAARPGSPEACYWRRS